MECSIFTTYQSLRIVFQRTFSREIGKTQVRSELMTFIYWGVISEKSRKELLIVRSPIGKGLMSVKELTLPHIIWVVTFR